MLVPSFPFKQAAMATPLLGMLFFSINTNNIPSVVTKASINMYADDTALYASHSNAITAAKVVSDDQAKIHNWCFENSLIINCKKTYAMFLSRNKVNIFQQRKNATIILNGSPLKSVSEIWEFYNWCFCK